MRVVAASALLLAACATHRVPNQGLPAHPGELQREFTSTMHGPFEDGPCEPHDSDFGVTEIAIERTACFGPCPIYTLKLFADGRVEYFGQANVPHVGARKGKLETWRFHRLSRIARDIHVFDLNDRYSCDVTDNPTVYVAVAQNGKRKIIEHYAPRIAGPAQLMLLEDAVDDVMPAVTWDK